LLEELSTISQAKDSLRKLVLEAYRDEHKEYVANWRNLETKAQGTVAVAGIFIAGVFAFLTKSDASITQYENFLLLMAVGFLVSSVISSVLVLKTRKFPQPPLGAFVDHSVKYLLPVDDSTFFERLERFNVEYPETWRVVIKETEKIVRLKADRLWIAQILLVFAISSVALATVIKLVHWGKL
jgi:hypothetical protein